MKDLKQNGKSFSISALSGTTRSYVAGDTAS